MALTTQQSLYSGLYSNTEVVGGTGGVVLAVNGPGLQAVVSGRSYGARNNRIIQAQTVRNVSLEEVGNFIPFGITKVVGQIKSVSITYI